MVPKGLLKKIGPFLEAFKPRSDCEPVSCTIVNMASCCRGRQPAIRRGWSIMIHCAQGLKEGSERVGGSRSDKPGCLVPHCSYQIVISFHFKVQRKRLRSHRWSSFEQMRRRACGEQSGILICREYSALHVSCLILMEQIRFHN